MSILFIEFVLTVKLSLKFYSFYSNRINKFIHSDLVLLISTSYNIVIYYTELYIQNNLINLKLKEYH